MKKAMSMKYGKIGSLGVAFLLSLSFLLNPAFAEQEKTKTMRFSISIDEPTVVDRILYVAFQRMGRDISFEATGMTNAIQTVDSGEKDGLYSQVAGLEQNFPNLVMVPERVADVKFEAYALKDKNIEISSWSDFKGLRVGTLFQKHYIHNHLPSDIAELVQKETVPHMIQALLDDECDVIVTTNSLTSDVLMPKAMKKAGLADSMPAYPYLNKKHALLVPELVQVIRGMKEDGTFDKVSSQQRISNSERTVLRVASFYADMAWEKKVNEGLEKVLPKNTLIDTVYLNSNRVLDNDERAKSIITSLRSSILKKIPDVVIVSDKNAMDFMFDYYSRLFTKVPVVFCGVEELDGDSLWKMENGVTGIMEEPSAAQTVERMLAMFPRTKNIFVINDYMETGRLWKQAIDRQLEPFGRRVAVTHSENVPFADLLETLRGLPDDTLVLSGFYYVDKDGMTRSEESTNRQIAEVARGPVFGLMDTTIGYGQLGGKYTNGFAQGSTAARMATALMNGSPLDSMAIRKDGEADNRWIFDYEAMQKWNVQESALPSGALLINKPLTMREANPTAYYLLVLLGIVTLFVIAALSIFMLFLKKQNKRLIGMQKNLHTAEELLEKDAAIKEVKVRLEKTIDSAPLVYMLLSDGKIVETNAYLQENLLDIETGNDISRYVRDFRVLDALKESLLRDGVLYGIIWHFRMKNGNTHRFHINSALVEIEGAQAAVIWGVDIEESERHKDSLAKKQEELQKLIDTVPTPIFICDPEVYCIKYANRSFIEMFGFASLGDALGVSMRKFHPEKQPDGTQTESIVQEYAGKIVSQELPGVIELRYERPDGKELYAHVMGSLVVYDNSDSLILVVQNMEEEKRREALLRQAAEKEREANQMKSLFLMNMSHEIRTPMNAIIGLSQLALHAGQNPTNADIFEKINISAKNLLNIINDILDFSKIEAEKIDLLIEEFALEEVIANAFMMASEKIGDKKIEMLVDIDPGVPCSLLGDRTRVWQVLKNLLDNSAKYTEKGHIVLKVESRQKGQSKGRHELCFVVEDTGFGMNDAQLQRLFEPFEQFHANVKNVQTGTGLGMPITKQLVEIMGGSISVESRVGEGTRTTVVLPLGKGSNSATMEDCIRGAGELNVESVLIADDDEYARRIMENLMKTVGVKAVCVSTGQEVLDSVKECESNGQPFKVIILDYLLGEDNGIEIAGKLQDIASKNTKLLMVSAYSKQLLAQDIERVGFRGVIEKPFVPSNFIDKICSALRVQPKAYVKQNYRKFAGARVLICEDNAINQDVAKGMLGVFGIDPVVASNGQEGIERLEREAFHIVFMDIMMPVMDGHETTIAIRKSDKPYKDVPIVAMTANVMPDEVRRCHDEGMNGHIGKPMGMSQIYECLLEFLPREITECADEDAVTGGGDALSTIEGIDTVEAIGRFGGDEEKYWDALRRFAQTLGSSLLPGESALLAENREHTRRTVHTLKGVSGNLGITGLYQECVEFEKKFLKGSCGKADYESLIEVCRLTKERLHFLQTGGQAGEAAHPAGNSGDLRAMVVSAHEAFEASRIDACNALVRKISEADWQLTAEALKKIIQSLDEYAFEEAIQLLDREVGK